jgi:hypothetical protein
MDMKDYYLLQLSSPISLILSPQTGIPALDHSWMDELIGLLVKYADLYRYSAPMQPTPT